MPSAVNEAVTTEAPFGKVEDIVFAIYVLLGGIGAVVLSVALFGVTASFPPFLFVASSIGALFGALVGWLMRH
jgi:hypothetical protein